MSAPATALSTTTRRTVTIRLAGPGVAAAYLSVIFGLLLVFFPISFPQLIADSWHNGRLTPVILYFSVMLNAAIYLRIAHLRSARPDLLSSAYLGMLTVLTVVGFSFLLQSAVLHAQLAFLPNPQARVNEEILAHTYFGLISAIFLPYLVLRFSQNFWTSNS